MEHALREYARTGFARALGAGVTARNCERSVYNWAVQHTREIRDDPSWENSSFRCRYKNKAFGLLRELERGPEVATDLEVVGDRVTVSLNVTPQLVKRLKRKELDSKNLARYSPDVLWPEGPWAKTLFEIKRKDLAMEAAKAEDEDYEGMFTCKRCSKKKVTYTQAQTRSADEPSAFLLCIAFLTTFVLTRSFFFSDYILLLP
jgi:DNA-directed RNA polymerase subunit M/transcription elongation factor TFIIS